jgi:hypothetical protein
MSALTQSGIEAVKAGNRQRARQLLQAAVQQDRNDVQAWLWLSACVDTPLERRRCLEMVLKIDPDNDIARNGINQLAKSLPPQQKIVVKPTKPAKKVPPPPTSGSLNQKPADSSSLPYIPPAPDKSNVPKPYIPPARDKTEKTTYVPPVPDKSNVPESFIPEARDKSGEFIPDIQARDKSDELSPFVPEAVDPSDRQSFIPSPPPSPSTRKNESRIPPPRSEPAERPKWMSAMDEHPVESGGGVELEGGIYIPPGLDIGAVAVLNQDYPDGQFNTVVTVDSIPPEKDDDDQSKESSPSEKGTEKEDEKPKKGPRFLALISMITLSVLVLVGLGAGGYMIYQVLPKSTATSTSAAIAGGVKTAFTKEPSNTPGPTIRPTSTLQPTVIPTITSTFTRTPTPTQTLPVLGPLIESQMDGVQEKISNLRGFPPEKPDQRYLVPENMARQVLMDRIMGSSSRQSAEDEKNTLQTLGLIPSGASIEDYLLNRSLDNSGSAYLPSIKGIFVFGPYFHLSEHLAFAHEYAKLLLDKNFKFDALGVYPQCQHATQQCQAIRALIAGDSRLTMLQWLKQNATKGEYNSLSKFKPGLAFPGEIPLEYQVQESLFLNELGYDFVRSLYDEGGWQKVNQAYQNLPKSTEQILHPEKYITEHLPIEVPAPALEGELGKGWSLSKQEVLGEWMSFQLLAHGGDQDARIDETQARNAVTGWGGDHYQIYANEGGEMAMAVEWIWDTPKDEPKFADALRLHLNKRFQSKSVDLKNGDCWEGNAQVTCIYSYEDKTLWLLAPNRDILQKMLGEYPDFQ